MAEPLSPAPIPETERLILRGPARRNVTKFTRFKTSSPRMKSQDEAVSSKEA